MKKAWLYWASFIVYPSGKHVFCVQVECDYYVVNVLSVLNISKWPFQWFLARWPSSFFHHFVSAKQQKTPTPFAPKKMQTWTLTQEMEMPVPNSLSFKPHAAKLGQLTGLRFRCCVWPPPFPQCFPWQLKLKKKKFILPICSSPKEWTVKCTETRRSVMKGKWSNPLSSVMPHKTIFTHFQNRYDWQQMTERSETEERFVIQKLHSIYIFSMQTSTPCDRPMSGLWWKRPQCGCRDLCVTALWARLHAKTSVSNNPIQLNPVTGRPLKAPVHWAKNKPED